MSNEYSQNEHDMYFGDIDVCQHCPLKTGEEILENEAGGMREYKSYWHDIDGELVECAYGSDYWESKISPRAFKIATRTIYYTLLIQKARKIKETL